jgi:hypothetical protein
VGEAVAGRAAGAAVVGLAELMALDHGAHRPVEHEDAARERGLEQGRPLGAGADGLGDGGRGESGAHG